MKAIDVERIRFEFGESWTLAEKWDDSRAFLSGIGKLRTSPWPARSTAT